MSASGTSDPGKPASSPDDVPETVPGEVLQGEKAAEFGRALLMQATGTDNINDANRVALSHREPAGETGSPDGPRPPGPGEKLMTPDQNEHDLYTALAARAVNEDYTPIEQMEKLATGQGTTSEELDELVRGPNTLPASTTPRGAAEGRATEEDLDELVALKGRADASSSRKRRPDSDRGRAQGSAADGPDQRP